MKHDFYSSPMPYTHNFSTEIGCTLNTECSHQQACVNNRCIDPCAFETCQSNQECTVEHHRAVCVNIGKFTVFPFFGHF